MSQLKSKVESQKMKPRNSLECRVGEKKRERESMKDTRKQS